MLAQPISTTTNAATPTTRIVPTTATHALVKTAGGEITASSVDANPSMAAGLIKLKDGNYSYPIVSPADRAAGVDALNALKLGG